MNENYIWDWGQIPPIPLATAPYGTYVPQQASQLPQQAVEIQQLPVSTVSPSIESTVSQQQRSKKKPGFPNLGGLFNFGMGNKKNAWDSVYKTHGAGFSSLDAYKNSTNKFGITKANNPFSKGNLQSGASAALLSAAGSMANTYANKWISNGYKDKVGQGITTVGGTVGNLVGQFNPVAGAIISAGSGVLGGLTQRAFGVKTNQKNLKAAKGNISQNLQYKGSASSFDNVMEAPVGQVHGGVYKGGWFNKSAAKKQGRLTAIENFATNKARNEMINNIATLSHKQSNNMLANYSAFGGPMFGGINGPSDYQFMNQYLANMSQRNEFNNKPSQMPNSFMNMGAFGGTLLTDGAAWPTGLIKVGKGGTHEENPKGGVTVGADDQGVPNMVEQNETIGQTKMSRGKQVKDYVFSDRLTVPLYSKEYKEGGQMPYEMKALKKYEGKTFAKASEMLEKDSGVNERPNDVMSQDMLAEISELLKLSQEKERQKEQLKELMEAIDQMTPEQLEQFQQQLAMMLQGQMQQPSQEEQMAMQQQMTPEDQTAIQQQQAQQPITEQQAMMQQQVPYEGQPVEQPQEQVPYTGEGYSMSPEEQALLQQQMGQPQMTAYGGSINRFDGGGYITKDNFTKFARYLNIPEEQINELYDKLPKKTIEGFKALSEMSPLHGNMFMQFVNQDAIKDYTDAYNSLKNDRRKVYDNLNKQVDTYVNMQKAANSGINSSAQNISNAIANNTVTNNPPSEEAVTQSNAGNVSFLDNLARSWYKARNKNATKEDLNNITWNKQVGNHTQIVNWAQRRYKKHPEEFGDVNGDFNDVVRNEVNIWKQDAEKAARAKKIVESKTINWNNIKDITDTWDKEDIEGIYRMAFKDDKNKYENYSREDWLNKLQSKLNDSSSSNNYKALYEYIKGYNNTLANKGIPDNFRAVKDLKDVAYNTAATEEDYKNWNWGPNVGKIEVVPTADGKYKIQSWVGKDGKIHGAGENRVFDTLADYERSNEYLYPRYQLAKAYYDASKLQGFDRNKFLKDNVLWNNYIGSLKGQDKNYWNKYGDNFTLEKLFGNMSDEKLAGILASPEAFKEYFNSEEGRKALEDSYWFDQKAGIAHGEMQKFSGPGDRRVYYTVDNDGNRTYYPWAEWDDKWNDSIERIGGLSVLNDVGDKDGYTTYGQQIRIKNPRNPLTLKYYTDALDLYNQKKEEADIGTESENYPPPEMPLWPFGAGIAMQLGALGYNIANPIDTSHLDELAQYSKQSHYKPVQHIPISGYQPYRPINSRALIAPMESANLAANRQFQNLSAGNYGTAMAHIANQNNNFFDKVGQAYLQAEQQDRAHQGEVFKNNMAVNQYLSEAGIKAAEADSNAYSKAGNEAIAGLSAAYKYKADAEKDKGTAISSGLSGVANLLNSYAQQNWQNQWQNWAAQRNIYGPLMSNQRPTYGAYGGPVRRFKKSLI